MDDIGVGTVLVTGASSGLGAAVVRGAVPTLAANGARVLTVAPSLESSWP